MIADRIRLIGMILSILLVIVFALVFLQNPFPAFAYAGSDIHLIPVAESGLMESSEFMWNRRSLDLIVMALALFSTATASVTILHGIQFLPEVEEE